ncbi:hypothetical protein [Flagellimonas nanhaiensis]|uniref:Peptidase S74 domain-containing protein n=1 Tax=Flagellimonas nanhaiensis TaxID=2292706 RepID=A0A371JKU4_9FLAO|nr:hypothetical protein [Allomuricauda nanhaiensis]RDY57587.1 hypothetical protein DX873_18440 [Allomuricauda nanhaiensis]
MENKKESNAQTRKQIENSEIWYSNNNTIIGNSGTDLKPYGPFNDQNNRLVQISGNPDGRYGLPILTFVKANHKHDYGGSIMWLSDGLNNDDKRFAQISGHIKKTDGYITFNTRKETDKPGFFNSMIFDENGNLGIGTPDPNGWRLSVNGKIKTKEVNVEAEFRDSMPDKEDDIPSLKEVENYINANGHLKDIPSAKELKNDGVSLGEMSLKLLQKIQELTLYTIKQQKEIDELKSLVKK